MVLDGEAALGRGLVDIELGRLDGQVLAGHREALGHLLENQSLVLDHCVCVERERIGMWWKRRTTEDEGITV